MQKARRIYLYLLSAISLGVLLTGLFLLLHVLLDVLGIGRGAPIGDGGTDRQQLSVALALIGVGFPVWGVHWWLADRGLRPDAPRADEERGSGVRALYLSVVLGAALAFGAVAAVAVLRHLIGSVLGSQSDNLSYDDLPASISLLLVAGAAWAYHVAIRRRDMAGGPMTGAAAWLPRLYLYGAALITLQLMLSAFADLFRLLGEVLAPAADGAFSDAGYRSYVAADDISAVVVLAVAWLGHVWYARRLVEDPGWRGASERPARLRLAYFVAVILIAAIVVLVRGADAMRAILVPLFGATQALDTNPTGADLVREVLVALAAGLLWAIAWRVHLGWMRGEALRQDAAERSRFAEQLQLHVVAAVGLGFGAVGLAWLLGITLDVLLGGGRTAAADGFWHLELATFVPFAVLGTAMLLWAWSRAMVHYAAEPLREAGSVVRRAYLLLALAASILTGVASLGVVLYRLFGTILGVTLSGDTVSELSTPTGFLIVALAVALYHGVAQRRDAALRAAQAEEAPARTLTLSGPDGANFEAAIVELRATLPPGYRLEEG
ncbi:MAG: hypothetical protein E6J47_04035 [Chloroflexi bacterium]|nr:MAG: hypothetical protein E6J47_04035 [Chloroflexota bacterium]